MNSNFREELDKLKENASVDKTIIQAFLDRLKKGRLTRDENPTEHLISFFLPVDRKSKMLFLGHHILADDWIPPGGHINKGETPLDTVYREFNEELNYKLANEKIELFDISIFPVRNPLRTCRVHFDLWYMVGIHKTNLAFDKKEFYDAKWVTFKQALAIMKREPYKEVIKKLRKGIH